MLLFHLCAAAAPGHGSGSPTTGGITLPATAADTSAALPDSAAGVNTTKLVIVGAAVAGTMIGIHLYQESGWWKYNRAPFHFREDLEYGLGVDKIGHFYGTSAWAFGLRKVLGWADMPEQEALWIGSGGALLFQTFLEVEDGLSAWGFDRVDFLCDLGGALWPIGQHYSAVLGAVDIKLSYRPSELLNTAAGGGFVGQKHLVVDDYEGQTYWLAVPPDRLLPGAAADIWPDFLDVSVGYGVRNVAGVDGADPYSVVFISLDYDMTRIIPQTSPFLVTLSQALNFIHFPAPAIRVSPTVVFYGLYF
jgi:hypothetical protein